MDLCSLLPPKKDDPHRMRRDHILSAAGRCFVRSGFHGSTMQDVAAEAKMSAGNVYRYFAGKDAIVAGLVARDRAEATGQFEMLVEHGGSLDMFGAAMRGHVMSAGRDKAALWLEICAEAARNPAIATVTRAHEAEILRLLTRFFAVVIEARAAGAQGPAPDPHALARLVMSLFGGLMLHQATATDAGIVERRLDDLLAVIRAAVEGRVPLTPAPTRTDEEPRP